MQNTLLVTTTTDLSAERSLGATAYMMEALAKGRTHGSPWLLLSRPTTSAVVLGRYQSIRSVNYQACRSAGLSVLRRLTGGTTLYLGPGTLHYALAFSLQNGPIDCRPRQILQKYGATVTAMLTALKLRGRYFGKDLVSSGDQPVGLLSFELDAAGVGLIESVIGVERVVRPSGEVLGQGDYAVNDEDVLGTLLGLRPDLDSAEVTSAAFKAASGLFGARLQERSFLPLECERIKMLVRRARVSESDEMDGRSYGKRWRSGPVPESIGVVEATVGVTQGRFLTDVTIQGDFMADSPSVAQLQQRLRMCPVERRQVALIIDEVFGAPNHVILGIRRLGSILDAILDAAGKGVAKVEG